MDEKVNSSRTMRIDLIPDAPSDPQVGKKKRIVFAAAAPKSASGSSKGVEPDRHSNYRELLRSVYDGALITDLTGRIVDCNPRACEFFLFEREEFLQLSIPEIISGADEKLIGELWQNLQNERYTLLQAHCVRKDGSVFAAEIAVNKLLLGEMRLCFFVRDITIRRQAEDMLRTEHHAIQNAGDGIAVADLTGALEYANPSMARMWGCSDNHALIGCDVCDLFQDREVAAAMVAAVLQETDSWVGEMVAARRDAGGTSVQVTAARNKNADGEAVGLVISVVDISDRKRAEEALRQADHQRVMLESVGAATHHLAQPATVLLGNLELLQRKLDGADALTQEMLETSLDCVRDISAILHRLHQVNEYRTMKYLGNAEQGSAESRILDI
jgi:PAS domain S-box-containing protein